MNTHSTPPSRRVSRLWMLAPAAAAVLAVGIVPRLMAESRTRAITAGIAEPLVQVVEPTPAPKVRELLLPGSMQPWTEASVRARSSGYVSAWQVDIGARVRVNEPLATLVAPEIEAQLTQARDAVATAQSNVEIAQSTAQRWQDMLRTRSISQQDTDQKLADLKARQSELAAAQANVARIAQMFAYTRVVAPFAGTVTARNVDIGTLVDAGGSAEMFHIARTDRLRIFVAVPDDAAHSIVLGGDAQVLVGGRTLAATVARTTGVLDPATHTMRIEIDVDNSDGTLLPGAFAQVRLTVPDANGGVELPVEALLFRPEGPTVATLGADGRIALKTVRIRRDLGTKVVLEGTAIEGAKVVMNPSDATVAGQHVRVAPAASKS